MQRRSRRRLWKAIAVVLGLLLLPIAWIASTAYQQLHHMELSAYHPFRSAKAKAELFNRTVVDFLAAESTGRPHDADGSKSSTGLNSPTPPSTAIR